MLQFHNTLTGKKEEFKPIKKGQVGMYHCGPTVYDYPHIGNLRAYVFADILRRTCEYAGYKVTQVINITDFGHLSSDADSGEDKMTKGLKREGKPLTLEAMEEMAQKYTKVFFENLEQMNIKLPTERPVASKHIQEDVDLIKTLEDKGFIYKTSDGLYFDTSKDPNYGALSPKIVTAEEADGSQSRIGDNPEKKNPRDFAVWKFNPTIGFQSPWGQGFPGWHIECSAMSMKYLGNTFDIHTGGIDHIPVHHNNEIAQSECATGKPLAHYWLHSAHIIINSEKMSKSIGNIYKLQDLIDQNIDPLDYRYLLLGAHYSTQINFTLESVQAAHNGLNNIRAKILELGRENGMVITEYKNKFKEYINNDLDTPKVLALLSDLLRDDKNSAGDIRATVLEFDKVLGLRLDVAAELTPKEIIVLVDERETARKNKDWKTSDELRDKIIALGYEIKDTEQGPTVIKNNK